MSVYWPWHKPTPRSATIFSNPVKSLKSKACQMHRDYYRGLEKAHHPLTFFKEPQYEFQCPKEMSQVYLSYPSYHVKYKQPAVIGTLLPVGEIPTLPERSLKPRYNKAACKAFSR